MAKRKFKLTTVAALGIAVIVLVIVVLFATSGQTAQFFAARPTVPTQPGLATPADLVVTDVTWIDSNLNNALVYIFSVTVKNQGGTVAGTIGGDNIKGKFEVSLTDTTNNVQLGTLSAFKRGLNCVLKLDAGQSATCDFIYPKPVKSEPFQVTAFADPFKGVLGAPPPILGMIKESNEANNQLTVSAGCALYPFNGVCGNSICENHIPTPKNRCPDKSETVNTCGKDCSAYGNCGDGICNEAEKNYATCAADCG